MASKKIKYSLTVNNKVYSFAIKKIAKDIVYFECEGAGLDQEFMFEDIGELLLYLPDYIVEEQQYRAKQKDVVRFKVSKEEKSEIMKAATKKGYSTVSAYLRDVALG